MKTQINKFHLIFFSSFHLFFMSITLFCLFKYKVKFVLQSLNSSDKNEKECFRKKLYFRSKFGSRTDAPRRNAFRSRRWSEYA